MFVTELAKTLSSGRRRGGPAGAEAEPGVGVGVGAVSWSVERLAGPLPGQIADVLSRVMPHPLYIPVSAHTGEGIDRWIDWLERLVPAERRSILTLRVE